MNQNKEPRVVPHNDLDFQYMTINPVWGKDDVSGHLRDLLTEYYQKEGGDSQDELVAKELWGRLSYLTQDVRLANLNAKEMVYCQYFLDLAGDLLNDNFINPFMTCIARPASVLDLSQSKGGFLRRLLNTFYYKASNKNENEPQKMNLGGFKTGKKGD